MIVLGAMMWDDSQMTGALCAAMLAQRRGDKVKAAKLIDRVVERVVITYRPTPEATTDRTDCLDF